MENHLVLVDKKTNMIKQIILVESFDNASDWENSETLAIPDKQHSAHLYGSWDGKNFIQPTNEKLIELGLLKPIEEQPEEINA